MVAEIADDVLVMYAGRAMEHADRRTLYYQPHHPYTRGLLASLPRDRRGPRAADADPGAPPSLIRLPGGCPFHPRCSEVLDALRAPRRRRCASVGTAGHVSACWLARRGRRAPSA